MPLTPNYKTSSWNLRVFRDHPDVPDILHNTLGDPLDYHYGGWGRAWQITGYVLKISEINASTPFGFLRYCKYEPCSPRALPTLQKLVDLLLTCQWLAACFLSEIKWMNEIIKMCWQESVPLLLGNGFESVPQPTILQHLPLAAEIRNSSCRCQLQRIEHTARGIAANIIRSQLAFFGKKCCLCVLGIWNRVAQNSFLRFSTGVFFRFSVSISLLVFGESPKAVVCCRAADWGSDDARALHLCEAHGGPQQGWAGGCWGQHGHPSSCHRWKESSQPREAKGEFVLSQYEKESSCCTETQ